MKLVNWTEGLEIVNRFNDNLKKDKELSKKYYSIAGVIGHEDEARKLWKEIKNLWRERCLMLKR